MISLLSEEIQQERLSQVEILQCTEGFDRVETYEYPFAKGQCREMQLYPGLGLYISHAQYYENLSINVDHSGFYPLVSKFYLSGRHHVITPNVPGIQDHYDEIAGQHYLFFLPDIQEVEQYFADQRLSLVKIELELDFLRSFALNNPSLPVELQHLIDGKLDCRFHDSTGAITPALQLVLQQILHCPYQGLMKRMYLEGKALELLTLQLHQWTENTNRQQTRSQAWRSSDVERLHYAKEILVRDLHNPPSLLDLARQVGLNDYKLKQGFRQIFGTTVFGYLQSYRMKEAKQLLTERELSIAGIAQRVGYASQSRFCDAFKRQFGMSPREYRSSL